MLANVDWDTASVLLAGSVGRMSKLWKALVPGPNGWKGWMASSDAKTEVPSGLWAVLTTRGAGRRAGALVSSLVEAMLNVCVRESLGWFSDVFDKRGTSSAAACPMISLSACFVIYTDLRVPGCG